MENAIITVEKTKKGKIIGKITFPNGKKMPIPPKFKVLEGMNNKECEVKRDTEGQIVNIQVEGKELEKNKFSKVSQPGRRKTNRFIRNNRKSSQAFNRERNPLATAPYNFISLNKKVISVQKPQDLNRYYGYTGYIDIEIETKTPIFIKGTGSEFYKQGGTYRIPGSSLRGMIRTLVEIVSWSEFVNFNDNYLYYRSFADKAHRLRDEYNNKMKNSSDGYSISAGFLIKENLNYYIVPGSWEQIKKNRVNEANRGEKIYSEIIQLSGKQVEFYACEYKKNINKNQKKYLIVSGPIQNKTHDWLIKGNPDDRSKKIQISKKDVESYLNDINRKSVNLIEQLNNLFKERPEERKSKFNFVPCFYIKWKDREGKDRISFGHTGMFRISYEKSIGEHIFQSTKEGIDLAKLIFGLENKFMTRVYFEDAFLLKDFYGKIEKDEKVVQTLSAPKPTSFQLYLDQSGVKDVRSLKHYNDDVDIRGNKLYWHKDKNVITWKKNFNLKIDTKVKPINPGAKFKGRIRFENLTDIELGALLFVLDLPDGFCYKIGMGKPLGLGSVKFSSKLFLSDRKERYKKLLSESEALKVQSKEEINRFKKIFEKFILEQIGEGNIDSLWNIKRLKELAAMLDFNHKPDTKKTRYTELREFKNRGILQTPKEIVTK